MLLAGASITKNVKAGAIARLTLRFDWPQLSKKWPQDICTIGFGVVGEGSSVVEIRRTWLHGKPRTRIQIIKKSPIGFTYLLFNRIELSNDKVVRSLIIDGDITPTVLTVAYRHGLVTVRGDNAEIAQVYVENGSRPLESWLVGTRSGQLVSREVNFTSTPRLALTREEQQLLVEAHKLNSRAVSLQRSGKYQEALPLVQRAIETQKKILGAADLTYAHSLNSLAVLYTLLREHAKAEPLAMEALRIRRKALGEEHPVYAYSLNNLGKLYESMGAYSKAEPLLVKARDIWTKSLTENNREYTLGLNNLAILYLYTGEYSKAEPLLVQACGIGTPVVDKTHRHYYALSLSSLAALYKEMGHHAKAVPLYERARDILRHTLDEEHPDYGITLTNLGQLYVAMGKYDKALPPLEQARDILEKMLGQSHPGFGASLHNLANVHSSMRRYAKAERLYEQAGEICKNALGDGHPDYATNRKTLAIHYTTTSDYSKAQPLFQEAFVALEKSARIVVPTLSEAQAISWMATYQPCLDDVLANAKNLGSADPADVYRYVWRARSLASRLQTIRRPPADASGEARAVYSDLRIARRELAQLILANPKRGQIKVRLERLNQLNDDKEKLERKLAALNSDFRRQQELLRVEPTDLARHLPAGTAVVDISHQTQQVLGIFQGKINYAYYDAFVLLRADNSQGYVVNWAPLRLAEPIDKALSQWRAALQDGGRGGGKVVEQARQALRTRIWEKIEPLLQGASMSSSWLTVTCTTCLGRRCRERSRGRSSWRNTPSAPPRAGRSCMTC